MSSAEPQSVAPAHAATRLTPETTTKSVQPVSEYTKASALYRSGDRKGALAKIERLLSDPHLTGNQRTFLERQKAICEGKSPVNASSPVDNTSAIPQLRADCGPRALAIVLKRWGISASSEELGKLAGTTRYGTTMAGLAEAARAKGLIAEGVQMDGAALKQFEGVGLAWTGDHYLAMWKQGDRTILHDPNETQEKEVEIDALIRQTGGIFLTVQRSKSVNQQIK